MIDRITPATVTGVDTSKKNEKLSSVSESDSSGSVQAQALAQAISSGRISGSYGSIYLKARDTQSNISFSQQRMDALQTVSSRLSQLKNLASQYVATKNSTPIEQQDAIVAQAQQALNSIDQIAASSQFLGTKVISDASSGDLGLSVINLESGDPVSQISSAMGAVGAKMAQTMGQGNVAENKLDSLKKSAEQATGAKISDYEAEQIAKSLFIYDDITASDTLYTDKLTAAKVSDLIGN